MKLFFMALAGAGFQTCVLLKKLLTAKCLLAMRLTIILLTVAVLQISARGYSQRATLSVKETKLEKVFQAIERQTGYYFAYSKEVLQAAKKVNLHVTDAPLDEVLRLCFLQQPLTYTIIDKVISVRAKMLSEVEAPLSPDIERSRNVVDITGKVTDADGTPLAGASVKVKNSTLGTSTNTLGEFTLKAVDENATLIFSYAEHESVELKLNGRTTITVALKRSEGELKEVIINKGYYNEKRGTTTGSVSTVTAKDIEKQPVNNPLLALQGRIPGMDITQTNGLPGGVVKVQLRGLNSLANGNLPLYIVDGVPYVSENLPNLSSSILGIAGSVNGMPVGGNPLNNLNPSDIESIDVLKDADATAIFGSRGANGVILITTKKGKAGKLKVDLNFQNGFGKVPKFMDLLNTRQYLDMRYEAIKNDGLIAIPNTAYDLTVWDTTQYTDWQRFFIGGTSNYTDAQASLSGGTNITQYLFSTSYHKETTVFPGNFNNRRAGLHFNINSSSINDKFHFLLSTNYTVNNNNIPSTDFTQVALNLAPNAPSIYNSDGSYNWANLTYTNPYVAYVNRKYNSEVNNLISNAVLSYKILSGLEIKGSFGYTNIQTNENKLDPAVAKPPAVWSAYGTGLRKSNFLNSQFNSWILEPHISYSKKVNKGQFSFLLGSTFQKNESQSLLVDGEGFNSDLVLEDAKAASITRITATNFALYKYNALFGRLNFSWDDKYLINITGRRDGTSRFGPSNRFHNFGAIGLAWIFSKEKLFQTNVLSFGKLRGSYGTTGNQNVGDYSFLDLYSPINTGVSYQGITSLQLNRFYTPDLQWEETKKLELGLELGFYSDRIFLTTNYYRNTSSNQLVGYSLPQVSGFTSITTNLPAKIENTGWEFSLNTVNVNQGHVHWTSTFNLFWNRNKLKTIAPGMSNFYNKFLDRSLSSATLYKYAGISNVTGQYLFFDYRGNITTTPNNTTDNTEYIDRSPKFSGGVQNSLQFKSFKMDFFFHFIKQTGTDYLFNFLPGYWSYENGNQPTSVLSRWQKNGDNAIIQRFNQSNSLVTSFNNVISSDHLYTDVSFVRLKNVSVSWQFSQSLKRAFHLQNGRIYIQGQNLLTLTKYHGMDPENLSATSLPPLRVITFGVQLTF